MSSYLRSYMNNGGTLTDRDGCLAVRRQLPERIEAAGDILDENSL